MGEAALGNFVIYVGVTVVPLTVFWLAFNAPRLVRGLFAGRRRVLLPAGPPIERIAADLRRVRKARLNLPQGANYVRRTATEQAYDALLAQAAGALRVPQRLQETPAGLNRDLERVRVEDELRSAGLRLS